MIFKAMHDRWQVLLQIKLDLDRVGTILWWFLLE